VDGHREGGKAPRRAPWALGEEIGARLDYASRHASLIRG
jgi:hypothetical protein